jgi:hypothetical protein
VHNHADVLDARLCSTAIQKLALERRAVSNSPRLTETVDLLATAAQSPDSEVGDAAPLLWGFATVGVKSEATEQLLCHLATASVAQNVSRRNFEANLRTADSDSWPDLTTADKEVDSTVWAYTENSDRACKELCTLVWASATLLQYKHHSVTQFMDTVAAELSKKLHNNALAESFTPTDLADVVWAYSQLTQLRPQSTASSQKSVEPRNVGALLDTIATDVRRQLANKHSLRAAFHPGDLVKIAQGYASLQHYSPQASGMLDAIAGLCVRRVKDGHLMAPSKPADVSALLQAYAQLGHATVVIPELLTGVADQMRRQLAHPQQQVEFVNCNQRSVMEQSSTYTPARFADVLEAFVQLGFHPGGQLLMAINPHIATSSAGILDDDTASRLLSCFRTLEHDPGDLVLELLLQTASKQAASLDLAAYRKQLTGQQ